jgi:hypothetical protein
MFFISHLYKCKVIIVFKAIQVRALNSKSHNTTNKYTDIKIIYVSQR